MARSSMTFRLSWRRRHFAPESLLNPLDPAVTGLLQSLVTASKEIGSCKKPSVCQRTNVRRIAWRISLLSPLFEEIKDSGVWVPPSALLSFRMLRAIFRNIKAIIHDCRHTSVLVLLMDQEALAQQFCQLSSTIAAALATVPLDLLDISLEVREQAELVHRHTSQSAFPFIDPAEKSLQLQLLSVMALLETESSPNPGTLKLIFDSLGFHDAFACEQELALLEKQKARLRVDNQLEDIPNINNLMSFVRYARCILYGLVPQQAIASPCSRMTLSSRSLSRRAMLGLSAAAPEDQSGGGYIDIPDDFKCPISLEIMVDPVIVATGQTYERSAITRWLEDGRTTCPKSGMKLLHHNLTPNCNLRRLISQWCKENDYVLEPADKGGAGHREEVPNSKAAVEATKLTAEFLIGKLESPGASVELQRQAAHELRLLAKDGMDNRAAIASAGAIPTLGRILSVTQDPHTQKNAVTALLNLSINDNNKGLIMEQQVAMEAIVRTLSCGMTLEARENAAAALFSLTAGKDHRVIIGRKRGAIPGLLRVLQEGRTCGKKDAAASLFNIALHGEHAVAMVTEYGAMATLEKTLRGSDSENVAAEVVALMALLARKGAGLAAACELLPRVGPEMVRLGASGGAKAKEHVVALLVAACTQTSTEVSGESSATILRQELRRHPTLLSWLQHIVAGGGSPRAQRKAASLFSILQRHRHS